MLRKVLFSWRWRWCSYWAWVNFLHMEASITAIYGWGSCARRPKVSFFLNFKPEKFSPCSTPSLWHIDLHQQMSFECDWQTPSRWTYRSNRASQIVISSQDVYPVVKVWPCPTALSRNGSIAVHRMVPVTAWYLTSHIYQLDQVAHKHGIKIHWTDDTFKCTHWWWSKWHVRNLYRRNIKMLSGNWAFAFKLWKGENWKVEIKR